MDNSKKPDIENPRKNANIFSQLYFLWLVPLLRRGAKFGLTQDDLTKSLTQDDANELGTKLEKAWEKELKKAKSKNKKPCLRNVLFGLFFKSTLVDGIFLFLFISAKVVLPVVLAQLLLQYQKPTSIVLQDYHSEILNRTTRNILQDNSANINLNNNLLDGNDNTKYVDSLNKIPSKYSPPPDTQNSNIDDPITTADVIAIDNSQNIFEYFWNDRTCLSFLIIFLSLTLVLFNHHADLRQRLVGARMRVACCSAIYRKILRLSKKSSSETAAGYVVNLLSNDVSRLDYGFIMAHYIWILPVHSVIICYLIWQQIGIASLVGVIGLLLKTVPVQTGLSKVSSKIRMKVALRTDNRVGIMNEIIQGIQVIKMYAWEKPFEAVVAEARRREIRQVRYASYIRAVCMSTIIFTERSTLFITIAACVFMGQDISADKVFSLAQFFNILQLLAAIFYPLAVSLGAEALVSIQRVQKFLMQEEYDSTLKGLTFLKDENVEPKANIMEINGVTASWSIDSKRNTLDNINFYVTAGNLCAIIGPVGAGKSSLLQLLLGELPIQKGNVIIKGDISYASQEPWLFPGTVRNNILFGCAFDQKRYKEVVQHCALITDFEQLPHGDRTLIGERGASLSGGQKARISLARAVYKKAAIYLLDDPLSAVDSHVGRHLFDEVIGPNGYLSKQKAATLLVTHQVHFLKDADWVVIFEDGRLSRQGTYKQLANSDLNFAKILEKDDDSNTDLYENVIDDEDIPYIDGYEGYKPISQRSDSESKISSRSSLSKTTSFNDIDKEIAEEQADGGVSMTVWKRYFLAGGGVLLLSLLFFVLIASQVITSGSDYFVNYWTQQEFLRANNISARFSTEECLTIYGIFILAIIIMTMFRSYLFFKICMTASKFLHNKMFSSILHAPMRFFDTNPAGRILNRFSRDMGAIDELLPRAMMEAIQILLVMVGILSMVTIVNPMLFIPLAGAILFYTLVLRLYLRPAQDLKRLEGICKSPVFGHLSATLHGLSVIRSNSVQQKVSNEFDELQNVHSGSWHLTMAANAACGLWLDCISVAFVGCVTFSFIFQTGTFAGNVGLAISQALILTGMVQYGVRQTAESIQQMTCVERVLQYSDLKPEFSPDTKPKDIWPTNGHVNFKNMSLRYDEKSTPILKNLNIDIQPGFKVGIVGRTGAGKSSLITALFRLANIQGEILIDGIDTGTISLDSLRKRISIIPQDPVLFSATIRYNLDPFKLFDDEKLWNALEEVELKQQIGHLDFMVTEGGSNFSVGQRQLICLARAILRNNKILVLDEATANVDPQTDALIQKTIRSKFVHCTVLTIAHRLHTVMDSNRILVMEAGSACEFGVPHILLQIESGVLRGMVEATGIKEAESLKKIAADNFKE